MPIEPIVFTDDLDHLEEVLTALDRINNPITGHQIAMQEELTDQLKVIQANEPWITMWLNRVKDKRRSW